jgi:glycosyltransferase involved in cell wall biosynthesis
MRIVFDAYWWSEGPPSLRHVEREIILAWHRCFPGDEQVLVTRAGTRADDLPDHCAVSETALWPQAFAATRAVAHAARVHHADAVITHNFAARPRHAVSTVYLHDVLFLTNPEWFTPLERAYFSLMPRWVDRADVVFASSRSEAARIRTSSDAHGVLPVGLGLSTELTDAHEEDPQPGLVPREFVLTVGRLNVRKNLELSILAALDTGLLGPARPLVVVGAPDGRAGDFDPAITRAVEAGSVVFTGFVSEARLRWLYRNTALFVCLPLGEGFGMPPVEAAYFGAPVLVSDLDVFHENLGESAHFVDPFDRHAISNALTEAISHPEREDHALELKAQHDWATTVHSMRAAIVDCVHELVLA